MNMTPQTESAREEEEVKVISTENKTGSSQRINMNIRLSSIQKPKDVSFAWMILLSQNNLINVVIYFVPIVLMLIFTMLNLNVHVVSPFMVKFEVHSNISSHSIRSSSYCKSRKST